MTTITTPTLGIMIDIETLGTGPDAVILSLAMLPWNIMDSSALPAHPMHVHLGIEPQLTLVPPRKIDASTLLFWMDQSDEARAGLQESDSADFVELEAYMRSFIATFNRITDGETYEVWTRGMFDLTIVESLLKQLGMQAPWHFRSTRDLRTLMAVAGVDIKAVPEPAGFVKHDAMWDCKFQIACYEESMRQLRASS